MVEEHKVKLSVRMLWDYCGARPRTRYTVRRYIVVCTCGWRSRPVKDEAAAYRVADIHRGVNRRLYRPSRRP